MSLPAKERVYKQGLELAITYDNPEVEGTVEFSYSYLDSGKTFTNDLVLFILGQSLHTDLIRDREDVVQMTACDQSGEIYELLVSSGIVVEIRDMRTIVK